MDELTQKGSDLLKELGEGREYLGGPSQASLERWQRDKTSHANPRRIPLAGQATIAFSRRSANEEISQFYGRHHQAVCGLLMCGCREPDAENIVRDTILVIRAHYAPE